MKLLSLDMLSGIGEKEAIFNRETSVPAFPLLIRVTSATNSSNYRARGEHDLEQIHKALRYSLEAVCHWQTPALPLFPQREGNPFKVLILLYSFLRTQDKTTGPASERLSPLADTPEKMVHCTQAMKRQFIRSVFTALKLQIFWQSAGLSCRLSGKVPDDLDELLKLKGVGRRLPSRDNPRFR